MRTNILGLFPKRPTSFQQNFSLDRSGPAFLQTHTFRDSPTACSRIQKDSSFPLGSPRSALHQQVPAWHLAWRRDVGAGLRGTGKQWESLKGGKEERRVMLPDSPSCLTTVAPPRLNAQRPRSTRLSFPSKCIFTK